MRRETYEVCAIHEKMTRIRFLQSNGHNFEFRKCRGVRPKVQTFSAASRGCSFLQAPSLARLKYRAAPLAWLPVPHFPSMSDPTKFSSRSAHDPSCRLHEMRLAVIHQAQTSGARGTRPQKDTPSSAWIHAAKFSLSIRAQRNCGPVYKGTDICSGD